MTGENMVYEDLLHLTDREIQMMLREVDTKDLALAMVGTSEALNDRYFSNVSERVGNMLRDEMAALGEQSESDIVSVQSRILQTVLQLRSAGEVSWPKEERAKSKRELSEAYLATKEKTKTQLAEKSYLDMSFEEITETVVGIANVARYEGVLEMENLADTASDDILLAGMRLVIDGSDPELIQAFLGTRINFLIQHVDTLHCMIFEGIIAMHGGDSPRIVDRKMKVFYVAPYLEREFYRDASVEVLKSKLQELSVWDARCEDVADVITDMSVIATQDNKQALEQIVPLVADPFLAQGLRLMIDDTDFEVIQDLLETRLEYWKKELEVKCHMVVEGMLMTQAGNNPRIIEEKVRCYYDFV